MFYSTPNSRTGSDTVPLCPAFALAVPPPLPTPAPPPLFTLSFARAVGVGRRVSVRAQVAIPAGMYDVSPRAAHAEARVEDESGDV